jgi:predicted nucleic acid-binding protein
MQMPAKVFIDSNIIIHALGQTSSNAGQAAKLLADSPIISTQVLSETINVLSRKPFLLPIAEIRRLILTLEDKCHIEIISAKTVSGALDIAERYKFSWYDSLIVATAISANCSILYTEDMQHHQKIDGGLRIVNPYKTA